MLLLFLLGPTFPWPSLPVLRSVAQPSYTQLAVGQTTVVNFSLTRDANAIAYHPTYATAGPIEIVSVTTFQLSENVLVHVLAPGRGTLTALGGAQATIDIFTCDEAARVTAPSIVSGVVGQYSDLMHAVGSPVGGSYQWYGGKIGDTSNPLKYGTSADYNVISKANGITLFWVRYTSACGYADAAVMLQTGPVSLRQRAARH